MFPLRRGDLAIRASIRTNVVEPLSSIVLRYYRWRSTRWRRSMLFAPRDIFPFLLFREPRSRDSKTRDIAWSKVAYYVSMARLVANIATICSDTWGGGSPVSDRGNGGTFACYRCVFTGHFKVIEPRRKPRTSRPILSRPDGWVHIYVQYISTVYMQSMANGSPSCMNDGMLIFIGVLSLAHLLCGPVRAESALCPLLSRFIRCTDDYRKPHLRSPTLIASPSSSLPPSAPFLSPRSFRVSLSSLRFELRFCISVSRVLLLLLLLLYSSHWTRILLANCSIRFDTFVPSYSVVTKISHGSCGKIRVKNGVTYVIVIVIVKQSAIFQKIPLKTITFAFLYICAFR